MSVPSAPQIEERPWPSSGSIRFYWSPPASDGGSPILYYTLACASISFSEQITAPAGTRTVSGLTNGTEHVFTLTATNANGTGPAATFISVQPGVIPFGPSVATASTLNSSTALVTWDLSTIVNEGAPKWLLITVYPSTPTLSSYEKSAYIYERARTFQVPSTNIYYRYLVQAINDTGYCKPFAYTSTIGVGLPFNYGTSSILGFARMLADSNQTSVSPRSGGALTIDSQSLGNYDYSVVRSNVTISSFTATSYFTTTQDTNSAWVIVKGNLTIESTQVFTPSVRKLFTVLYVTGDLICNGSISMTARGANHSGIGTSGGFRAPTNIRLAYGTFGALSNPIVPANGGAGGNSGYNAFPGAAGTNGGTGGGGGRATDYPFGIGSAGTSFSGGTGGGTERSAAGNGGSNGGAGGAARANPSAPQDEAAGAGNPGAPNNNDASRRGRDGTGGVLVVISEKSISGSGTIEANGVQNRPLAEIGTPWKFLNVAGGSTGGGSVTVFHKNGCTITPTAAGGESYQGGYGVIGGAGGAGTARVIENGN